MSSLRPIGSITIDSVQLALLLAAGNFATDPETMPAFYGWLQRHIAASMIPPPDQIPGEIADISDRLARPVVASLDQHRPRARGAGARVP